MKLPAVALVAAFASGIVLGLQPRIASHSGSRIWLVSVLALICVALLAGLLLTLGMKYWPAAFLSLIGWAGLGLFGAMLSQKPLAQEHILNRLSAGQIDLKSPLRYLGRMRSEPSQLPWGYALDIELSGVESADGLMPLRGGLRVGFTPRENDPALPPVHAGDDVAVLTQAHLPLLYKDEGAFNRREFLAQQNIHLLATLRASSLLEKTASPPPSIAARLSRLRARLRRQIDNLFAASPESAGILRAMLLGDRSFVDQEESVDFQKTGVFHVLVVAGLHVGVLAFFLFRVTRLLRLRSGPVTFAVLASLLAYIVIVEQRPPVLRAGLMAGIVVLGTFFYRRLELLNSAALAALLLLVSNPKLITESSFQLSFLAIVCIAAIALEWMARHTEPYLRALRGWNDVTRDASFAPLMAQFRLDLRDALQRLTLLLSPRAATRMQTVTVTGLGWTLRASELLVISLVLQIGMLPLMARDFHRVTLIGPLANMFVVPLTGVIVPLGFLTLGISLIVPLAARALALPLTWLVSLQGHVVHFLAAIPSASYRIPGPVHWVTVLFFLGGVTLAVGLRAEKPWSRWICRIGAIAILCSVLLIAIYPFHPSVAANTLEITVLDVGQGDSILVVSPKGSTLLIDGGGAFHGFRGREEHLGPDPGEEAVSPYLWSRGIQKLDAVALTHAHQDHIGGLSAILQNFKVGQIWLSRETAAPALARFKEVASRMHVPIQHEVRGQSFLWDGVQMDFLWPAIMPDEISPAAKNNDSLVLHLRYGERNILLPGDAEKQAEYTMLSEDDPSRLRADVLKVGHHGSKNSTMPEFLAAVSPQVAIISAGEENPYGHPSRELLDRLEASGSRVLRTDHEGAVQIRTDGHNLQISCYVGCATPGKQSGRTQAPDHREHN